MANYTKQILRGSAILFVLTMLASFLGYIIRMLLTRKISVEEYGLFYAVLTFILFFKIFKDLGLNTALNKYVSEFNATKGYDKIKSVIAYVFIFNAVSATVITLLLLGFSGFLTKNYFKNELALKILIILLVYFWFDTFIQAIRGVLLGFKQSFLFSLGDFALNLIILVPIIFAKERLLETLAWSYAAAAVILTVFYLIFLVKTFDISKYKIIWSKKLFKDVLRFGIPVLFSSFGYILMGYTDTLMLTFFSLKDVGIYNVVLPTALMILIFGRSLGNIMFPISSEMWTKKMSKPLAQGIMKIHKYGFLIIVPIGLLLIAFPRLFLNVFFGGDYIRGALALQILVFAAVIYNIAIINNYVLSAIGKPQITLRIIIVAAVLNVVLNAVLIPFFSINGAALATFVCYAFVLIRSTVRLSHFIEFELPWLVWAKILGLGAVFLAVVTVLKMVISLNPFIEAFICVALASSLYVTLALRLKLWDYHELKNLVITFIKSG